MRRSYLFVAYIVAALLGPGLSVDAVSAGEIGLYAIEARLGYVDIGEGDAGGTISVSASADLGPLTPDLRLEVGLDFWSKGWDVGHCDRSWTNISFIGNVRYDIKTASASFRPYAFGGPVLCYQEWDWQCQKLTGLPRKLWEEDESNVEFGLDLGVGAEFGSGDGMTPVARIGYNANGGADYLFIQGGLKFPVGN